MTQGVLPFRFPDKDDDELAGLCRECLNAPIRVVPCGHDTTTTTTTTDAVEDDIPTYDVGRDEMVISEAAPATSTPSEDNECRVCSCWSEEHKDADHEFQRKGRGR